MKNFYFFGGITAKLFVFTYPLDFFIIIFLKIIHHIIRPLSKTNPLPVFLFFFFKKKVWIFLRAEILDGNEIDGERCVALRRRRFGGLGSGKSGL